MTKPPFVPRRPREDRRQLLQQHSPRRTSRIAEVVGGTTAEVAAVCCCVPCAVVDFVVLTMYKVPAGLCRNAMRRRRRRRSMMHYNGGGGRECSVDEEQMVNPAAAVERFMTAEADEDVLAFEDEMWERFSESGFWRSPEQEI
ncbi:hypothetical protein L1987_67628 [Smallanthus sonchifolius]|uniref:Uncharacterized protein n=1 Tax=Smallanthus sonchifolius TaxID=185202 RepID=A0ACB9B479_9ASTR|nr:hypothetical protein L1987_67628 [Smallanthus sonchifolius]